MKNGTYIVYVIEFKMIGKSPWLKPDEPIEKVEDNEWSICGEYFVQSLNPHIGTGNDWRPKDRKADEQWHGTHWAAGVWGFYDLPLAIRALRMVREDDSKGKYDSFDTYKHRAQAVRREYRIAKVTLTYNFEIAPISVEDVCSAIK